MKESGHSPLRNLSSGCLQEKFETVFDWKTKLLLTKWLLMGGGRLQEVVTLREFMTVWTGNMYSIKPLVSWEKEKYYVLSTVKLSLKLTAFCLQISCSTDWLVLNLKPAWKSSSKCSSHKKAAWKTTLVTAKFKTFSFCWFLCCDNEATLNWSQY